MASDEESVHPRVVSHCRLQLHGDAVLGVLQAQTGPIEVRVEVWTELIHLVVDDGQPQRVRPLVTWHGLHHLEVRGAELSHRARLHQAGQHRQDTVGVEYRLRGRSDNKSPRNILAGSSIPESVDVLEVWEARRELEL